MKTYGKAKKRPLDATQAEAPATESRVQISASGAEKGAIKQFFAEMSLPRAKQARPFMSPDASRQAASRVGAGAAAVAQKPAPVQMYLDFGQVSNACRIAFMHRI